MSTTRIGIIGLGPRGLNVLDRIIAYARQEPDHNFEVHLFDPRLPGAGVHDPSQPDHLLMNTVASQATLFSDDSLRNAGPIFAGPSFFEWLCERNGIAAYDGSLTGGESLDGNGYYPRALFGRYLNWVFNYLREFSPRNVRVTHHETTVDRITQVGRKQWRLFTGDGLEYLTDFMYLTTGHARKRRSEDEQKLMSQVSLARSINPKLALVLDPYPVKPNLASVRADQTVAVEGAGLAALDVISELTVGRRGRFLRNGHGCVYQPSGHEPQIMMFTRSGLPLTARAVNEKGSHIQYKAEFLTVDRIGELRKGSRDGKLNFERQVLPLLLLDMANAYYSALAEAQWGKIRAMQFRNEFKWACDDETRDALVAKHFRAEDRFCWDRLANPTPAEALCDRQTFHEWQLEYLKEDIRQAELGNVHGAIKAACDVLRDLRDTLRSVVDFAGLDEASHRWFVRSFLPLMNRLAVGPPKSRIEELIALIEAGIVRFDFGPNASCVFSAETGQFLVKSQSFPEYSVAADVLVRARIAMPSPREDRSLLMKHLFADGLVRPFSNGSFEPGGIEVDRNLNVVNRQGRTQPTFWSLGTPTEGCKFYTFVVPRPGVNSTALVDAGRVVGQMMDLICQDSSTNQQFELPVADLGASSFSDVCDRSSSENIRCESISQS